MYQMSKEVKESKLETREVQKHGHKKIKDDMMGCRVDDQMAQRGKGNGKDV